MSLILVSIIGWPLIKYKASRNMDIFYDEFRPKSTAFKEEGDSIVDEPIDIEWY